MGVGILLFVTTFEIALGLLHYIIIVYCRLLFIEFSWSMMWCIDSSFIYRIAVISMTENCS